MALDLKSRFSRINLGFWPSPIHPFPRLSKELGIEVWAKRDDVSSSLAFGGNKVRKLEWLAADAVAQDCDTLVSIGNIQSHHTRQDAVLARVFAVPLDLAVEISDGEGLGKLHTAVALDPPNDVVGRGSKVRPASISPACADRNSDLWPRTA